MYIQHLALLLLLCLSLTSNGQERVVDSMYTQAMSKTSDSLRTREFQAQFFNTIYARPQQARELVERMLVWSEDLQEPFHATRAHILMGIYHDVIDDKEAALQVYTSTMETAQATQDSTAIASLYNNMGLIYWNTNKLEQAMDAYTQADGLFAALDQNHNRSSTQNNLGLIMTSLFLDEEAIPYFKRSIDLGISSNRRYTAASAMTNLAKAYRKIAQPDSALVYIEPSLEIMEEFEDTRGQAIAHSVKGQALYDLDQTELAFTHVRQAEELFQNTTDVRQRNSNKRVLAQLQHRNGQYRASMATYNEIIPMHDQDLLPLDWRDMKYIGLNLMRAGKPKQAEQYLLSSIDKVNDEYNNKSRRESQDLLRRYETAERDRTIAQQEKQVAVMQSSLAQKEAQVAQRNLYLSIALGGLIIAGLIGFILVRHQRLKNRQLQQEKELQAAQSQLETQRRLDEQRQRISRDLHDNIGSQLTYITSSMDLLKSGTREKAPELSHKVDGIAQFTRQTITQLRDTVWAMNRTSITTEHLNDRILDMVAQAQNALDDRLRITAKLDAHHVDFSSYAGMNLFRIVQEALNNAIKHSGASMVSISTQQVDDRFELVIQDNGHGFSDNSTSGSGLMNMRKRADDIDAHIDITADAGTGTRIGVSCSSSAQQQSA